MKDMPLEQEKITVLANEDPLFSGLIENISISHEGKGYEITLTAATNFGKLDIEKENCSFQDENSTHEDIVKPIQADTPKAFVQLLVENQQIPPSRYITKSCLPGKI